MEKSQTSFKTFEEFWPFYLGEHSLAQCRVQHYLGSSVGLTLAVVAMITGDAGWLLAGIVIGYACAWWGHFVHEKNRPATFRYPLYSFFGDWKMFWMMTTGELDRELLRLGITPRR